MKRTPLYKMHKDAGAVIVPYAGWEMPVSYVGTVAEVEATRRRVGLFDVSHMGELRVAGPGAADFVQRLTSNDVSRLRPFQAQYSLLLNPDGGIVDDIIVYRIAADDFLIVVNAACKDKDWDWVRHQAKGGCLLLTDDSDHTALIAVQGPGAVEMADRLSGSRQIAVLKRFCFREDTIAGHRALVARTGYTGEDGVEVFCAWDAAVDVWGALVDVGAEPAGLGARDVLRLEAGYPLYGHELAEDVSPLESGVGWVVKTKKGDFIGRNAVARVKEAGITRRLIGIRMSDRAIPRDGYGVHAVDGENIGIVTSGTFSPTIKAGIALARVQSSPADSGAEVLVDIRGRRVPGLIVDTPFFDCAV